MNTNIQFVLNILCVTSVVVFEAAILVKSMKSKKEKI